MTISCAIITISDTRTSKTDESGQLLDDRINAAGHNVEGRYFSTDDIAAIQEKLVSLIENDTVDVVLQRATSPRQLVAHSGFGNSFACSAIEIGTNHLDAWLCDCSSSPCLVLRMQFVSHGTRYTNLIVNIGHVSFNSYLELNELSPLF